MTNLKQLRVFESIDNLRRLLNERASDAVDMEVVRLISAYLTQGRLYFEAASKADFAIRPLIIYYGMVAFSGAIVLVRTLRSEMVLSVKHHGLLPQPRGDSVLGIDAKVNKNGLLLLLNNVVCEMQAANVSEGFGWKKVKCQTVGSADLIGKTFSLKELLSRISGLEKTYGHTFGEFAGVISVSGYHFYSEEYAALDIFPTTPKIQSTQELQKLVAEIRKKFLILNRFAISGASSNETFTTLSFTTTDRGIYDEFSRDVVMTSGQWTFSDFQAPPVPRADFLGPRAGVFHREGSYLVESFDFGHVADMSLIFIAMFIMSTIVRYRPNVWMHALASASTDIKPSDDQAIALLEELMDVAVKRTILVTAAAISDAS